MLEADALTSGNAAKLVGSLSFASLVCLARVGRPFLQPLYALAGGRLPAMHEAVEFVPPQGKKGDKGLHPRVRRALLWWVRILVGMGFGGYEFWWA